MRVHQLSPGMDIEIFPGADEHAVVIAVHHPHPKYGHLCLVIWKVYGSMGTDRFSHDALDALQEVGQLTGDNSPDACWARLKEILPP